MTDTSEEPRDRQDALTREQKQALRERVQYDETIKKLMEHPFFAASFLNWADPQLAPAVGLAFPLGPDNVEAYIPEWVRRSGTDRDAMQTRHSDMWYKLQDEDRQVVGLVLLEFQSGYDPQIGKRLLQYMGDMLESAWDQGLYDPATLKMRPIWLGVVHTGRQRWPPRPHLWEPAAETRYLFRNEVEPYFLDMAAWHAKPAHELDHPQLTNLGQVLCHLEVLRGHALDLKKRPRSLTLATAVDALIMRAYRILAAAETLLADQDPNNPVSALLWEWIDVGLEPHLRAILNHLHIDTRAYFPIRSLAMLVSAATEIKEILRDERAEVRAEAWAEARAKTAAEIKAESLMAMAETVGMSVSPAQRADYLSQLQDLDIDRIPSGADFLADLMQYPAGPEQARAAERFLDDTLATE